MFKEQFLKNSFKSERGQSLVEVLIGISLAAILIGSAVIAIALTLRSNVQSKNIQTAVLLNNELLDRIAIFGEANWHNIYNLNKGSPYHLEPSESSFAALNSPETLPPIDGMAFNRQFVVENVSRNSANDDIEAVYDLTNDDPSTQKITITATWLEKGELAETALTKYLVRSKNLIFHQTDWSGGGGQPGPVTVVNNKYDTAAGITVINPIGSIRKSQ